MKESLRGRPEPAWETPEPRQDTRSVEALGSEQGSTSSPTASRGTVASFGPFRLYAAERVLEKDGKPLKIGSRAFDILRLLLESAPEVVPRRDLIRGAWGSLVVDDVSLRVHVAALRKRLGDAESAGGYLANVPGRGYSFIGDVAWTRAGRNATHAPTVAPRLPREPSLIVGRDSVVGGLIAQLKTQRFLSIVGAGGIGKTTIALALAHRLLSEFHGAVYFLDLEPMEDPRLLPSMLASQLGLMPIMDQQLPTILASLRDRRMLLVFDCCEHVVESAANLTESILRDAPQVHILTTSREALRAEGEQVYHLAPLPCPPDGAESITATQALSYPAVELFVQHIADSGQAFKLTDAEAPIVAAICRRLDGIALALELAASRVAIHGLRGTASLLDKYFGLLWRGRRTALPRHQTLRATLDWSYNLLSDAERLVLRRLAVFVGGFSLGTALDVASEGLETAEFTELLATLVEKSLMSSEGSPAMRYRLLDTTRAYASKKLAESGEDQRIARRHCEQLIGALEKFGTAVWRAPTPESRDSFVSNLGNIRAALSWCFSGRADSLTVS